MKATEHHGAKDTIMVLRDWRDTRIAAGSYPEDDDAGTEFNPSEIAINVLIDESCRDGSTEVIRLSRVYPRFMSKAAFRMVDYLCRKFGKHNVWVEYY